MKNKLASQKATSIQEVSMEEGESASLKPEDLVEALSHG